MFYQLCIKQSPFQYTQRGDVYRFQRFIDMLSTRLGGRRG